MPTILAILLFAGFALLVYVAVRDTRKRIADSRWCDAYFAQVRLDRERRDRLGRFVAKADRQLTSTHHEQN